VVEMSVEVGFVVEIPGVIVAIFELVVGFGDDVGDLVVVGELVLEGRVVGEEVVGGRVVGDGFVDMESRLKGILMTLICPFP
jgi:hypothetical protein